MSNPGSETNYVNDYATIPVPLDQRRSSFSLAMVLVGSIIQFDLRWSKFRRPAFVV